jgi:hypothetical protein
MENNECLYDALYRRFKSDCATYGLSVSDAIEIIIDREIARLVAMKDAVTNDVVIEEEYRRTLRVSSRKPMSKEEAAEIRATAKRLIKELGDYPSIRTLAAEAGTTRHKAGRILKEMRNQE